VHYEQSVRTPCKALADGIRKDDVTLTDSTTSMLLFTEEVAEGEGGETEFLSAAGDGAEAGAGLYSNMARVS